MSAFDANAGQTDDLEALAAMEEALSGWDPKQFRGLSFDPHVAAIDLLVTLPRLGWKLVRTEGAPVTVRMLYHERAVELDTPVVADGTVGMRRGE